MSQARYQNGSVVLDKKTSTWLFRWREKVKDRVIRRSVTIGTKEQFPSKGAARKSPAAEQMRLKINHAQEPPKELLFGTVIERYKREEMPRRFSTRHSYEAYIDNHIFPKWRNVETSKLTPEMIQMWLNAKTRKDNGQPLSGKTKAHIRALMQILFDRAMFWGYLPITRNPMELVRIKGGTRRSSRPNVLSPEQLELLLGHIQEDYVRLVVITSICLGLRFSEVLALKWVDIDWVALTIYVRRAIVLGRVDETKTEYSEAPAPLDPALMEALFDWRRKSKFSQLEDWIFASPFCAGEKPYFQTTVRKKVFAAAQRACIAHLLRGEPTKILRHSYRSWLGTTNAPVAVIKDLMRHADIRTTFNEYGNGLPAPMREANSKVVRMVLR
jgi:integrase